MTTSGTFTFSPDFSEIVADAWERIGKTADSIEGSVARSARRSLNFMFVAWANANINLWAIDLQPVPLVPGTPDYATPAGTLAVLDAYITEGTPPRDLLITAISRSTYAALADKVSPGRPTQFYFDRQISPKIFVWPVPQTGSAYTLNYYRLRRIQDVTAAAETPDTPYLWYEAICAGLAARMAEKWAPERLKEKVDLAAAAFNSAAREYRQRVRTKIAPDFSGYRVA